MIQIFPVIPNFALKCDERLGLDSFVSHNTGVFPKRHSVRADEFLYHTMKDPAPLLASAAAAFSDSLSVSVPAA